MTSIYIQSCSDFRSARRHARPLDAIRKERFLSLLSPTYCQSFPDNFARSRFSEREREESESRRRPQHRKLAGLSCNMPPGNPAGRVPPKQRERRPGYSRGGRESDENLRRDENLTRGGIFRRYANFNNEYRVSHPIK